MPVVRIFAPRRGPARARYPIGCYRHAGPLAEAMSQRHPRARLVATPWPRPERASPSTSPGWPSCTDAALVLSAIAGRPSYGRSDLAHSVLTHGFLRGARGPASTTSWRPRSSLSPPPASRWGPTRRPPRTSAAKRPRHLVSLSPWSVAAVPVTVDAYAVLYPSRRPLLEREGRMAATGVTWPEAALFSMWMRLPAAHRGGVGGKLRRRLRRASGAARRRRPSAGTRGSAQTPTDAAIRSES